MINKLNACDSSEVGSSINTKKRGRLERIMSKSTKRMLLPKELGSARELITGPMVAGILPSLPSIIPDTHTAQFNKEIYNSLVLSYEVQPPAGEEYIDINDIFKLTIKVSNTYEHDTSIFQLCKLVPAVWFKNVYIHVTGTTYAEVQNPNPNNIYTLVFGDVRLKPGNTVIKELSLKALHQISGVPDPKERIANIGLMAELDYDRFFTYAKYISAYTQIRPP